MPVVYKYLLVKEDNSTQKVNWRTHCLTLASGLVNKHWTLPHTNSFADLRLSLGSGLAYYCSGQTSLTTK